MRKGQNNKEHPQKGKNLKSQISSYDFSMKSQQINCPISTANRIQNYRSQSLNSVYSRYMNQRKDAKFKAKSPTKKKNNQGKFSQTYQKLLANKSPKVVLQKNPVSKTKLNNHTRTNRDQIIKKQNQIKGQQQKKNYKKGKQLQFSKFKKSDKQIKPQKGSGTSKKIEQLKFQINQLTVLLKRCLCQLKTFEKVMRLKQRFTEDRQQIIRRQKEENIQINIERIKQQITSLERLPRDLSDLFKDIAKKRQPLPQRRRQRSSSRFQSSNLFSCNILNKEEDYKLFLIQTLSNNFGEIRQTKFLYHQDNLNQNNIHRYIDGKRNIAIIIQTVDDYFVALFAQPPFQPRQEKGLTQRRVYKNLPEKSPIVYDEAFVIFGNSDVKIGDKQIHTQFGNPTSYYDCKGDKASILFGSGGKKDFEIKYLEIFEVIF